MCGFGPGFLIEFAIGVIVLIAIIALARKVFPGVFDFNALGGPYADVIRIVFWAIAAIIILLILWKFLACAGLVSFYR